MLALLAAPLSHFSFVPALSTKNFGFSLPSPQEGIVQSALQSVASRGWECPSASVWPRSQSSPTS